MQKCRQIAEAVIQKSPYSGIKFTRMIKDLPTGQALLMAGSFNNRNVAIKFFLNHSKRKEVDIIYALTTNPPCEYLIGMIHHFDEPALSIVFPFSKSTSLGK